MNFHIFKQDGQGFLYLRKRRSCVPISVDLYEEIARNPSCIDAVLETTQPSPSPAPRQEGASVYLNISASCNLQCVYCYANEGAYQQGTNRPMGTDVLMATLEAFRIQSTPIRSITFFGGEPLLRLGWIRESLPRIRTFAQESGWSTPSFSIVTNGVLLDESGVDFLAHEDFGVTVSIDGPGEIHDVLRPDRKGMGTFQKVDQNLRLLLQKGIAPGIEVTYTKAHLDRGISPLEILRFFQSHYGIRRILIAPAGGDEKSPWRVNGEEIAEAFSAAARYALESSGTASSIELANVRAILENLRHPRPSHQYCYADLGVDHFAVSSSGKLYPCQMFNEQEAFDMGSVFSPQDSTNAERVRKTLSARTKEDGPCSNCWAKDLCTLCQGGVFLETKDLRPIPEHRCILIRRLAEVALAHEARRASSRSRA